MKLQRQTRMQANGMPVRRSGRTRTRSTTYVEEQILDTEQGGTANAALGTVNDTTVLETPAKAQLYIKLNVSGAFLHILEHGTTSAVGQGAFQRGTNAPKEPPETLEARGRAPENPRKRAFSQGPEKDSSGPDQLPTPPELGSSPKKPRVLGPSPLAKSGRTGPKPAEAHNVGEVASVDDRPLCIAQPFLWAHDRPSLCETTPYYRAWQSAAYTYKGFVHGMLLDEDVGGRTYIDQDIVIARAGGCMSDGSNGKVVQIKDHDENNAAIKAFFAQKAGKVPVILILGNNCKQCPSKIPHRYCVMTTFIITDIWREMIDGKAAIFYRFQRLDLDETSWWAPADREYQTNQNFVDKAPRQICAICNQESPQRFEEAWVCANHNCQGFGQINGNQMQGNATYDQRWLNEREQWTGFDPPYEIEPQSIDDVIQRHPHLAVTEASMKGIRCPRCGCCVPRTLFKGYECPTSGCGFKKGLEWPAIPAQDVSGEATRGFDGHAVSEDKCLDTGISVLSISHGFFRVTSYDLGSGCKIAHFHSNKPLNMARGGPNDIFEALQKVDFGLKRNRMTQSVVAGQLTKHFTRNFGLPYNFIAESDCSSFSEAPAGILEAVRRMRWAGRFIVGDGTFQDFNECLAVGYLESNKMGYHDDGEDTLGPTVASLSIGSPASFKFRLKAKYLSGFDRSGNYDPNIPVLDSSHNATARRELNEKKGHLTPAALTKLAHDTLPQKKVAARSSGSAAIDLRLNNGDIVVMHGADIQKYLEHESSPEGLRFALTCRHIMPEKIQQKDHEKGMLPDSFNEPSQAYDGDLKLYQNHKQKQREQRQQARLLITPSP